MTENSVIPWHQQASNAASTAASRAASRDAIDSAGVHSGGDHRGGILLSGAGAGNAAIIANDATTEKIRKTSQFLSIVDEELRHLSITEVSDED